MNTTWGLDKKSGIWWKINEIYLLGNTSLQTWNNQTHANLSILTQIYRNHKSSFNHSHVNSYDEFNICIDDYYDHPVYGAHEIPASEIGLYTSPRVWVEGPIYMLSLESNGYFFLCGTHIYVTLPT